MGHPEHVVMNCKRFAWPACRRPFLGRCIVSGGGDGDGDEIMNLCRHSSPWEARAGGV